MNMTTVSNCGNKIGPKNNHNISSNTIVATSGNPKRYLLPQKSALNQAGISGSNTVTAGNGLRIMRKKVSNVDLEDFLKNQTLPDEVSRQIHRGNSANGFKLDQQVQGSHMRSMTAVLPPTSAHTSNYNAD